MKDNEKELTAEEVVKALEMNCLCVAYDDNCDKCPLFNEDCGKILPNAVVKLIRNLQENNANQVRMRCDMQRKFDDLQTLCTEQKAEIERLLEENFVLYRDRFTKKELDDISDCRVKKATAELQKQVEELERIKGFSREEVDEISETAIKNSRKETAEKIYTFVNSFGTNNWKRFKNFLKQFGVE